MLFLATFWIGCMWFASRAEGWAGRIYWTSAAVLITWWLLP